MTSHPHFAADYSEARKKFIEACTIARLPVTSFTNPELGPNGEPLYTDYVTIGPHIAERLLVVNSAIHGVEGFCGSAAIIAWLTSGNEGSLPNNVKVIFVHALNPYGFAWLRRVNEGNVDLNRNFISHDAPVPDNAEYDTFHPSFIPPDWDETTAESIRNELSEYAAKNGLLAMQTAVCRGQYKHRDGLFYGGLHAAWSHRIFKRIIGESVGLARHIVLLDFHTGAKPPEDKIKSWFTDRLTCAQLGNAVGPDLFGTIGQGLRQIAIDKKVYSITAEFGTFDVFRVLMAIIADNWLHLHGDLKSTLGADIKREIRGSFYPDADDWCEQVLTGSQRILNQVIKGLASI